MSVRLATCQQLFNECTAFVSEYLLTLDHLADTSTCLDEFCLCITITVVSQMFSLYSYSLVLLFVQNHNACCTIFRGVYVAFKFSQLSIKARIEMVSHTLVIYHSYTFLELIEFRYLGSKVTLDGQTEKT